MPKPVDMADIEISLSVKLLNSCFLLVVTEYSFVTKRHQHIEIEIEVSSEFLFEP